MRWPVSQDHLRDDTWWRLQRQGGGKEEGGGMKGAGRKEGGAVQGDHPVCDTDTGHNLITVFYP